MLFGTKGSIQPNSFLGSPPGRVGKFNLFFQNMLLALVYSSLSLKWAMFETFAPKIGYLGSIKQSQVQNTLASTNKTWKIKIFFQNLKNFYIIYCNLSCIWHFIEHTQGFQRPWAGKNVCIHQDPRKGAEKYTFSILKFKKRYDN